MLTGPERIVKDKIIPFEFLGKRILLEDFVFIWKTYAQKSIVSMQ